MCGAVALTVPGYPLHAGVDSALTLPLMLAHECNSEWVCCIIKKTAQHLEEATVAPRSACGAGDIIMITPIYTVYI